MHLYRYILWMIIWFFSTHPQVSTRGSTIPKSPFMNRMSTHDYRYNMEHSVWTLTQIGRFFVSPFNRVICRLVNVLPLLEGLQVVGSCWIGWNFLDVSTFRWNWRKKIEFQETRDVFKVVFIFGFFYLFLLFPFPSCRVFVCRFLRLSPWFAPENRPLEVWRFRHWKPPFSGANMLVSGRV